MRSSLKVRRVSFQEAEAMVLAFMTRQQRACYIGELCLELSYWSLDETESLLESMVYEGHLARDTSLRYRLVCLT